MGYIKLDQQSFFNNLDYFSSLCKDKNKLCIALKDNAYGHGTVQVATMCQEYGIKHVFVRDMEEANLVKDFDFESILVLYDIPEAYDKDVVVSINSLEHIKKIPQKSKVELKIDTGMNRNGIIYDEIKESIKLIEKNQLILNGVFTHFCCADEDNDVTKLQEELFLKSVDKIKRCIDYDFRIHCANSAGVHRIDMDRYDLARVGIGAYGYLGMDEEKFLKPVMSLYGEKITTKSLKKGDHVGYGSCAYVAKKGMTVSNYNIGYGDGFYRFSEKLTCTIADGREILGRVSMDSFSIEGEDNVVCIFDNVNHLANTQQTITYDILVGLSSKIKRYIA